MPNYSYECSKCGGFQTWQSMKDDPITTHEGCGGTTTKEYGPVRTASLTLASKRADATEARWQKDMPAYKRFREKGYQPPGIDGCDKLEATAQSNIEIQSGGRLKYSDERVNEGKQQAEDIMKGRV